MHIQELADLDFFAVGTKVRGEYHGKAFIGVVTESRGHTMNRSMLYSIDLDETIMLYQTECNRILFATNEPNANHADWIAVI